MDLLKWMRNVSISISTSKDGDQVNLLQAIALSGLIFVLSLFLSTLLTGYFHLQIPAYREGDIARMDVVVPEDILIKDVDATMAKQAEARAKALPVYRFDPAARGVTLSRLSAAFAQCKKIIEAGTSSKRKRKYTFRTLPPDVRSKLLATMQGLGLNPPLEGLLSFLVKEDFNAILEGQIAELLRQGFPAFVVSDDSTPARDKSGIYSLNTVTGKTGTVPMARIFAVEQARLKLDRQVDRNFYLPASGETLYPTHAGGCPFPQSEI